LRRLWARVTEDVRGDLEGILLLLGAALSVASLYSDATGSVGRLVGRTLRLGLGEGAWLVPLFLCAWGFSRMYRRVQLFPPGRALGACMLMGCWLTLLHARLPAGLEWEHGLAGMGGGVVGAALAWAFLRAFGPVGRWLVLAGSALAGFTLCMQRSLTVTLVRLLNAMRRGFSWLKSAVGELILAEEEAGRAGEAAVPPAPPPEEAVRPQPRVKAPRHTIKGIDAEVAYEQLSMDPRILYQLPPLSLLDKAAAEEIPSERMLADRSRRLEQTLASFGVRAKVVSVRRGPAVTRFELQPEPGVKVSRIMALADDIALSMATSGVRMEAPVAGKSVVGIEVPNEEISMVHLREVLETREFREHPSKLAVGLGKDIAGRPVVPSLEEMLHILIAGATGSGKSVCINSIIASILFKARPDEVKLLLVDPKVVELSGYDGIPHLLAPVITDPRRAAASLQWLVGEMERRYELFAGCGVRNIQRYNERVPDEGSRLPYVVVVVDELVDLMTTAPVEVEDAIFRLAQMARAAGIHLVVATQRPSVDVLTGTIKANIPSRIAFAVSSQVDSRTILDVPGAERLLGRGDMLFYPVGASKPVRVQGAYISERERENLVRFVSRQAEPEFNEEILKAPEQLAGNGRRGTATAKEDELLPEALRVVVEAGHASVSLLQRKLRIGYTRAARIIDIMEARGWIGGFEGSKPREVYVTLEDYDRIFSPGRSG